MSKRSAIDDYCREHAGRLPTDREREAFNQTVAAVAKRVDDELIAMFLREFRPSRFPAKRPISTSVHVALQ